MVQQQIFKTMVQQQIFKTQCFKMHCLCDKNDNFQLFWVYPDRVIWKKLTIDNKYKNK